MRKGNLIKLAAPAILSAAMMVSGLPVGVMAADFTEGSVVEASADEFTTTEDDKRKVLQFITAGLFLLFIGNCVL